jgi:hypothetical protein
MWVVRNEVAHLEDRKNLEHHEDDLFNIRIIAMMESGIGKQCYNCN